MISKVVAIVVTYNRKELLIECLRALLEQSIELVEILVIDNDSTDGTEKFLEMKGILKKKSINYIRLSHNIGGAGGFYEGLKRVKDKEYDWVWLMDDDTIPQKNALKELLDANEVVNDNTGEKVSFLASSVYGENGEVMNVPEIDNRAAANGYLYWYKFLKNGIVSIKKATFVSILVSGDAIKRVGLPCKEYFIWGDDSEYTERMVKYAGNAYMVGNSIVTHKRKNPRNLNILNEDNFVRLEMYHYMFRNQLINTIYYHGKCAGVRKILVDIRTITRGMKKKSRLKIAKQIIYGDFQGIIQYKKFHKYITKEVKNGESTLLL
ncbi:glycosyltransferase family 2 protein [Ligilactobacillus animalis]|uniref:glycosyltransferase family 2 protein n=1 Tax=Ligilactobacillus animalis TaxID=1605 RepID=UPI001373EF57|nr:glycosyltransferase family 2 protein [Ligilactobacillus animalis]QHQ69339.1 glycosyltransferase [Ligilactobacillus animalis]